MAAPNQFAGPASSVIQEMNLPGLFAGTAPPVQNLSGLGYFSPANSLFLPSNVTEIINMTSNALLAANVEIQGNLQVDGIFSAASVSAGTSATNLGLNPGPLTVVGPAPNGGLVTFQNTSSTPTAPTFTMISAASGDRSLGLQVSGDSFSRLQASSTGVLQWGPGTAAGDVQISRSALGTLTIQPINSGTSPTLTGQGLVVQGSGSAGSLLQIINQQTTPNAPGTQLVGQTPGDRVLGFMAAGDGFQRLRADTNGQFNWGSGSGAVDTNLYRLSAGTLRTDNNFSVGGTILGGADATSGDISVVGVQAAGSVGKLADAGHVHPLQWHLSNLLGLTGVTAETVPRGFGNVSQNTGTLTTSSQFMRAIALPANLPVLNITFAIGTTLANGVTHGYYFITDANRVVKATTADVTNNTTWNSTTTPVTLALSPGYTTPSAGLYYLGISVTASTTPTLAQAPNLGGGLGGATPILYGLSGSSATPPALGSTLSSLNAGNGNNIWAMTS